MGTACPAPPSSASGPPASGSMERPSFAALPAAEQEEVRRKQREKKLTKQGAKKASTDALNSDIVVHGAKKEYPDRISQDEYFAACPHRLFRDPNLAPTEANLQLLMSILRREEVEGKARLNLCNYFQFSGPMDTLWDPIFNARLAYEGFFTITNGRGTRAEPLPELQPFYGVVTWDHFAAAKHMRQTLSRLRRGGREYRLAVSSSLKSWEMLDAYQLRLHSVNWLTKRYFEMMQAASADPSVNFRAHCIELFSEEGGQAPVAGEIGFSIGKVYTSLSGWTGARTSEALGTIQLALLGRWLQLRGYAFWSLGHCYSPCMEYKRQLGHRVYPRYDFLELLHMHRGEFRLPKDAVPVGLITGDTIASTSLLDDIEELVDPA